MKILLLGGTQFVGRHITETLHSSGHSVSILTRGRTPDSLPGEIERLRGDRDEGRGGLGALDGGRWDACVDVSGYTARQVRASAERLRDAVEHYVYVSAVSVYGNPERGPVDETQPRLPPADEEVTEITAETYGPLKVTCEDIVQDLFPGRCTLLRPQVVAGPHDPYDRFSYWVRRAAQGGEMMAPGDGSDHVQVVDARDVARFVRLVCESRLGGVFNMAGPRVTWAEFVSVLGARNLVWVPASILETSGLTFVELPLYRRDGGHRSSLMHVSNDRARAAGLSLTDLGTTVADVRAWLPESDLTPALSPEQEAELIQRSRPR